MTVTQTTITGPVYLPNIAKPEEARIVFELSSWDKEDGEAVFVTGPYIGDLDASGNFTVNLFTTTEGTRQAVYHVSVIYLTLSGEYKRERLGTIALAGPGPYCLSDLTFIDPLTTASFDILAEIVAYNLSSKSWAESAASSAAAGVVPDGWVAVASEPVHSYKMLVGSQWYASPWDIIVAFGQSNMASQPTSISGDKTGDANVYAYDPVTGQIRVAALGESPFAVNDPISNNLAFHLCKRRREYYERPQLLIFHAIGNTSIITWLDPTASHGLGNGSNVSELKTRVAACLALPELLGQTKVTAVICHQGEADGGFDQQNFEIHHRALASQFREYTWGSPTLPFVAGEMTTMESGGLAVQLETLRKISRDPGDPFYGLASSEGLAHNGDNIHFDGESLVKFGRERYFTELHNMPSRHIERPFGTTYPVGKNMLDNTGFLINERGFAGGATSATDNHFTIDRWRNEALTTGTVTFVGDTVTLAGGAILEQQVYADEWGPIGKRYFCVAVEDPTHSITIQLLHSGLLTGGSRVITPGAGVRSAVFNLGDTYTEGLIIRFKATTPTDSLSFRRPLLTAGKSPINWELSRRSGSEERRAAARLYSKWTPGGNFTTVGLGIGGTTSRVRVQYDLSVPMRRVPTLRHTDILGFRLWNGAPVAELTALDITSTFTATTQGGVSRLTIDAEKTDAIVVGDFYELSNNNTPAARLEFDAEY